MWNPIITTMAVHLPELRNETTTGVSEGYVETCLGAVQKTNSKSDPKKGHFLDFWKVWCFASFFNFRQFLGNQGVSKRVYIRKYDHFYHKWTEIRCTLSVHLVIWAILGHKLKFPFFHSFAFFTHFLLFYGVLTYETYF